MAESLADLNLPGFPGRQERLPGGPKVCALAPGDFSPPPPPRINYRSGEAGEGAAAPRPRRARRHTPLSTQPPGGAVKIPRREFLLRGFPRGARSFPPQGGTERERERGAGDALKRAGQRRPPPAPPRVKYHPGGRDSHGGAGSTPFPAPVQSGPLSAGRTPSGGPFRTRGAGVRDTDTDIKLGIARVRVSVRIHACRVGCWGFWGVLFFLALFTPSESCQIGNYSNGQSFRISGRFSAKRYQNGKLPSELPRPLQDCSAQR